MTKLFTKTLKALFISIFAFGALAISTDQAQAQVTPEARIVFIDFSRVTSESLVGQDVASQLESSRVRLETRAGELDQLLQVERQELERQQSIIAPDAFEERVRGFQQRQLAAQNEIEQLNTQHQRGAQEASIQIQRVLRPIIIEVMESKQATIVFDRNQAYHTSGGLDVTTTVIDRLNSALSNLAVSIPASAQ
jgi:Skp family chaperone for outer membrane proteins